MRTVRPLGLQPAQPAGYYPGMSAVTSKPPYIFPQQKPTDESYEDGYLLRREGSRGFFWRTKADLKDGDVWVPGCDAFFRDHGDAPDDAENKMMCADRKWQPTAETDE